MSVSDPLSDMLTRIRNATRNSSPDVVMPHSRLKADIARILVAEGYVAEAVTASEAGRKLLRLKLRYVRDGASVVRGCRRVSKPGLRRYVAATEIPRPLGGLGMAILSTSRGVMSGREAKQVNIGGEVLCYVW